MAGNDYQIDFSAADPISYLRIFPELIPTLLTGRENDPLSGAAESTSVESLTPANLALGQIVPFEFRISVDSAGTINGDTITITAGWETLTTNGGLFGYDGNLGIIAAFVDASDPSASSDTDAFVSNFSWTLVDSEIQGTFEISNLDPGEEIVLETWVVLQDEIPVGTTGNVQSRLINAETSGTIEAEDAISTGNQTIPLLRVKDFFSSQADLSVAISDSNVVTAEDDFARVNIGEQFTYTIIATNNSDVVANQVVLTDNLDARVRFIGASIIDTAGAIATLNHDGSSSGGTLIGDLGFLNPGEEVTIEVIVEVLDTATTGIDNLSNTVSISSINDDPDLSNNTNIELTDVLELNSHAAVPGVFTVNDTGRVEFDYLYDGGWFQGELAVFSLQGMEVYEPGSIEFLTEATARALSNSSQGRVLISDRAEGAHFSDTLSWEKDFNFDATEYQGVRSFDMEAGDNLAFMLVQHTTIQDIYQHPYSTSQWGKKVLFSTDTEQIAAVDNNGTIAFEDIVISSGNSDRDYNDFIFQVRGLVSDNTVSLDEVINPDRDWRDSTKGKELLEYADRTAFSQGVFKVGESGEVSFDYLYDGGWFQGELALFSIEGMDVYQPGSDAFIAEATRRALTNSELGYVVTDDRNEGARFSDKMSWEKDFNFDPAQYQGVKSFTMNPGDEFALMLVQHTTVLDISDPTKIWQWGKLPLFSIPEANPGGSPIGQMVDVDSSGTYAFEDVRTDLADSDRDYNDFVFQIKGARGTIPSMDLYANSDRDWRNTDIGAEILAYSNRALFDEGVFQVGDSGEVIIDFLYDGGWYQRAEVGIFSLDGMDMYQTGSTAFVEEAINRTQSNSSQGYTVVKDFNQGAKFSADLSWESDFNGEEYQGKQTFLMNPGDTFGLVLVPDGSLDEALTAPDWAIGKDPLFSMAAANLNNQIQFADIKTSAVGTVVGFEDVRLDIGANQDYNDIVLAIEGVQRIGLSNIEDVVANNRNWLGQDVGREIIGYFDNSYLQ